MHWYIKALKNYATFRGRATRTEYWMFTLFSYIFALVPFIFIFIDSLTVFAPILIWLYAAAMILPSLAVTVRRLHDTGRSGWWYLINFVPVIGGIWLLILLCQRSEVTANIYDTDTQAS
ncbi:MULTISPECIES: DUF805 domain-containing protein [Priestia]|jgi:uncharacterized membrane protein YhaH (DUF805 family)|uniref:DUF805 domain-containing protein n=1 Tax=Priestia megaterium TaxID=1404 RepID=A0AA86I3V3_PRIMG|nr:MULTISPECIES: DUF805 domain-containing protein [Priestia]AXI29799.1 DUF805 domain-containing protein [Priestia megaterium]MCM3020183.1 DUF805 domain-containing protein [Priestia megaterium]MCM3184486.1 DUF805 domain-containing protein [Priestia megaterium]MCM3191578.1 DUF805 domain-containing protein [Priestia megaterium]MDD1512556.1 DUF805 domain-containing protein [Priestia megaterium]